MRVRYLVLILLFSVDSLAQDILVLNSGERIPFMRMQEYEDVIRIKDFEDGELVDYLPDSVLGYAEVNSEQDYFLIFDPEDTTNYLFVERLIVGPITLYVYEKEGNALFAEKNGELKEVYNKYTKGEEAQDQFEQLLNMVSDDNMAFKAMRSAEYRHRLKDIEQLLMAYNQRNYEENPPVEDEILGSVYIYRTRFQKTKDPIHVTLFEESEEIWIEDFIHLQIPVNRPVRLLLADRYASNEVLLTGQLGEQFYEVLYDRRSEGFVLDDKSGTELQYEFYDIKRKVGATLPEEE